MKMDIVNALKRTEEATEQVEVKKVCKKSEVNVVAYTM